MLRMKKQPSISFYLEVLLCHLDHGEARELVLDLLHLARDLLVTLILSNDNKYHFDL